MEDTPVDDVPLSRLARLLVTLSVPPVIWLPKSAGGHTRQYFPVHQGKAPNKPKDLTTRIVKNSGSAVFDTFATVHKDRPLVFHWPDVNLDPQQLDDLKLFLGRMTYFGRAESWCRADANTGEMKELPDVVTEGVGLTHWRCVCIEDAGNPDGKEYRDYTLERRLAPCKDVRTEAKVVFPRTNRIANSRPEDETEFGNLLGAEPTELSLLRCLLRESGQDVKDGLERPIGTRWVHYAVPRAIYDVPRPKPQPRRRTAELVDLVRYALNTATVGRAVLPAVTDTLLVADKFRSAVMALCRQPSVALSGHEPDGSPCKDHQHAWWWPMDEDKDGFIDHVMVYAPGGFEQREVDALRRLTRLRQRGGRPDLLTTPTYVGQAGCYPTWQSSDPENGPKVFVSATPYLCPVHLSHGRGKSGRIRSLKAEVIKGLRLHGLIDADNEVFEICEFVFDYMPSDLAAVLDLAASHQISEPVPPRQYFPVIDPPQSYPPLPHQFGIRDGRYQGASLKNPDEGYCFGTSIGFIAEGSGRFIRALSFCRRRRGHEVRGHGRMLQITFSHPRSLLPFAIGSQSHFGLGLFVPSDERETT